MANSAEAYQSDPLLFFLFTFHTKFVYDSFLLLKVGSVTKSAPEMENK